MKHLLYLMLLPLLLLSGCINEEEPETISLQPGDKCPTFSIVMNDGSILSSPDLKGHKNIIVFFNTSCPDCRQELPVVQQVYDRIKVDDTDSKIICIARAEGQESIEQYWKENGLTLPYSPQPDKEVYNLFASSVIPRIYILSEDLTITQCWDDNPMPSYTILLDALR